MTKSVVNWIKKHILRIKDKPQVHTTGSSSLPQSVIWQSMLLSEDECLVYIDENKEVHYVTTSPFDPEKEYRILIMD